MLVAGDDVAELFKLGATSKATPVLPLQPFLSQILTLNASPAGMSGVIVKSDNHRFAKEHLI